MNKIALQLAIKYHYEDNDKTIRTDTTLALSIPVFYYSTNQLNSYRQIDFRSAYVTQFSIKTNDINFVVHFPNTVFDTGVT